MRLIKIIMIQTILTNLTNNYSQFIWLSLLIIAVYLVLVITRQFVTKEQLHMDDIRIKPAIVGFFVLFITPGLVRTLGTLMEIWS